MALKEISSNVEYIKWTEELKDVKICGWYHESKPSKNYPDNLNHYVISSTTGARLGLNGTGSLDKMFEQVRSGWYVEITYQGQVVLEKGTMKGRPCHQFKFAYDDENIHAFHSGDSKTQDGDAEYAEPEQAPEKIDNTTTATLAKPESQTPATNQPAQSAGTNPAPSAGTPPASEAPPKRKVF